MINEIKRRLEAGEVVELECINVEAISASNKSYAETLLESKLILSHVFANKIMFKNQLFIYEAELKYFRIKETAPTFDDLVDVVVQAAKGGLLEINMLNSEFITASIPGDHDSAFVTCWRTKPEVLESSINKVESLYTETFVIKSEKDMPRIKSNAEITLVNGEKITSAGIINNLLSYFSLDEDGEATRNNYVEFTFIKGATVTQKKTNN